MKLSVNIFFIIIIIMFTVSCGDSNISTCAMQSENNIIRNMLRKEVFTLKITAEITGGYWCNIEMRQREYIDYSMHDPGYFTGLSILVYPSIEKAKEHLQAECNETSRFHNLLACIELKNSTYDTNTKHYSGYSSITWIYGNRIYAVGNNYLSTIPGNAQEPNTLAESLYYLSILSGLIPIYTNEYIQSIFIIMIIIIILFAIRRMIILHNKKEIKVLY